MRLDYVAGESEVAERIRSRRGGRLTPLDAALLHSPEFADGWNSLLGAVRNRSTLPADIRELAILRVAELNGAAYEWAAHEPVARRAGLSDARMSALRTGNSPDCLDDSQQAALRYVDAMTKAIAVPQPLFDSLREHFTERQLLELTVTVAAYNMVSRVLVALGIMPGEKVPEPAGER